MIAAIYCARNTRRWDRPLFTTNHWLNRPNYRSAQEERESLLQKQEELTSELKTLRAAAEASATETERLTKCVQLLESTVDAASVERKQLDMELAEARQEGANA